MLSTEPGAGHIARSRLGAVLAAMSGRKRSLSAGFAEDEKVADG
jgi:hypothetical protein